MYVNVARDIEMHELRPKVCRLPHNLLRNHPVAQDALAVVDIVQEKVERSDPLRQPSFHQFPFPRWDDARYQIEGKNAFRSLCVVVNRKGHALREKTRRGKVALSLEIGRLHFLEG